MKSSRVYVWLSLLATSLAHAEPEDITLGDLALAHPICFHVQAIPITGWTRLARESPESAYWNARIGGIDMLWHMHHYCWALIHLRRAEGPGVTPETRKYLRGVAISDFYYVVRQAQRLPKPSSFLMLPEIVYRIGDTQALLGNTTAAIAAFEQSRAIKPDYWPPYLGHAQLLEKVGLRKEALRILEQGLQVMPGEANLSAAFKRLGGNPATVRQLPRPAPAMQPADDAASAASPSAPAAAAAAASAPP